MATSELNQTITEEETKTESTTLTKENTSDSADYSHLDHGAEAINTLAVIGSLMFGFGTSIWFDNKQELFDNNLISYVLFQWFLSAAIGCSGFATVSMTAHYYAVRIYLQSMKLSSYEAYNVYMESTHFVRVWSRYCLVLSFVFFYIAMIIYTFVINGWEETEYIVSSVLSSITYLFFVIWSLYIVYHSFGETSTSELQRHITRFMKQGQIRKMSKAWDVEIKFYRMQYPSLGIRRKRGTVRPEDFKKPVAPFFVLKSDEFTAYFVKKPKLLSKMWEAAVSYHGKFYLDALLYCACDIYAKQKGIQYRAWEPLEQMTDFKIFADFVEGKIGDTISQQEVCDNFITWIEEWREVGEEARKPQELSII